MEIKQLRAFLAVANAKSFLGAANSLYISRQAISKTISSLEEELGMELFVRNQTGAMMTPAGIFFYPRAVSIVAELDKLSKEMKDMNHSYLPKIQLCMALGIFALYARKLSDYAAKHRLDMDLQFRGCLDVDCASMLAEKRADAVLSFMPVSTHSADCTVLCESPIRLLFSKNSGLEKEKPAEILRQPMLLYTGGWDHCLWWPELPRLGDEVCGDLDYLSSLLREGRGVLPLPELLAKSYLDFAYAAPLPEIPPCKIYFSALKPNSYNAVTYDLISSIFRDVLNQA